MTQRAHGSQLLEPPQAFAEPFPHNPFEVLVERVRRRDLELRQEVLSRPDRDVTAVGDPHRVRQGLGKVLERRRHLLSGLEEEVPALVPHSLGIAIGLSGPDAQQDVVGMRVGLAHVVHVVGAHQRQPQVARDGRQARVHHTLLVNAMPLHLEKEVVGAEDVPVGRGRLHGLPLLLVRQSLSHLSLQAAAQADDPLRVLREQILVDARLVVEALGVAGRYQLDQVVVALVGLRQQHQVVGRLARTSALRVAAARRHVDLAPQNRLQAVLHGVVVEDDRRKQVAVLGDGNRRHLQGSGLLQQLVDTARAVEQRELGVEVQVNEFRHSVGRMWGS